VSDTTLKQRVTIERTDIDLTIVYNCMAEGCTANVRTPFEWSDNIPAVIAASVERIPHWTQVDGLCYCGLHSNRRGQL
jgi:hypothetical protein